MTRQVERALHQILQRFAVEALEVREARAECAERGDGGCIERRERFEMLSDRPIAGDGGDLEVELALPVQSL